MWNGSVIHNDTAHQQQTLKLHYYLQWSHWCHLQLLLFTMVGLLLPIASIYSGHTTEMNMFFPGS